MLILLREDPMNVAGKMADRESGWQGRSRGVIWAVRHRSLSSKLERRSSFREGQVAFQMIVFKPCYSATNFPRSQT